MGCNMNTILLVNDETKMLDLLSLYLIPYPYNCIRATSGKEGLSYLEKENVDLVILDVKMQGQVGWITCQRIRKLSEIPIIILTERNDTDDVIKGLIFGANDYITKPFQEEELLARIDVVLRRGRQHNSDQSLLLNGLNWKKEAMELKYRNHTIILTPKEFALVGLFLNNPHKVFSRDHLLNTNWGINTHKIKGLWILILEIFERNYKTVDFLLISIF